MQLAADRNVKAMGGQGTGDDTATPGRRRPDLLALRPYFRQVAGLLVVGSIVRRLMNLASLLPPVMLEPVTHPRWPRSLRRRCRCRSATLLRISEIPHS